MITPRRFPFALIAAAFTLYFVLIGATAVPSLTAQEPVSSAAELFRDKGCAYCHGLAAEGTRKGPSLAQVRKTMTAAQIRDQIENGGQKMPAFKESLAPDEITRLVQFLRQRHRKFAPPLPSPKPDTDTTPKPDSPPLSNPGQ